MFNSDQFNIAWDNWKAHKAELTAPYTKTAEQKALSALFKKAHGIEQLAIESIDWSIEKNWADIYIKSNSNGNGQGFSSNKSSNSTANGKGDSKVQAYREW